MYLLKKAAELAANEYVGDHELSICQELIAAALHVHHFVDAFATDRKSFVMEGLILRRVDIVEDAMVHHGGDMSHAIHAVLGDEP